MTDPAPWLRSSSLVPGGFNDPTLIIADKGNNADQIQSGSGQSFIFQWGTSNSASQIQSGSKNSAEAIQISPGALADVAKANAGGGNGGEFDIFGFEVDPGASGKTNKAKEPGETGSAIGKGNSATQTQTGTSNFARAVQIGWSNAAAQEQEGSKNASLIVQLGQGHQATSIQQGHENISVIVQSGTSNIARVVQK